MSQSELSGWWLVEPVSLAFLVPLDNTCHLQLVNEWLIRLSGISVEPVPSPVRRLGDDPKRTNKKFHNALKALAR